MQIEIAKEDYEFLTELAHELSTQDNRCTGRPYFYTVRCVKKALAPKDYGSGEPVWVDWELSPYLFKSEEDYVKILTDDYGYSTAEARARAEDLLCFGQHEIFVDENVFLTYNGYKQHMAQNEHNYQHYEKYYSYIKHAGRNPEMARLIDILLRIGKGAQDGHDKAE